MGSILYDGWRHMFFIYPAFVLVSLNGIVGIQGLLRHYGPPSVLPAFHAAAILLVLVSLGVTTATMVKHHPYQNVYFNMFAGRNMAEIKMRYEMDYWGLSYRKALEYILAHDSSDTIALGVANYPGWLNGRILRPEERQRFRFVDHIRNATYFVSNYRGHPKEYPCRNEVFSVNIDGAKIVMVCKLR
jgi:hypothetical protein